MKSTIDEDIREDLVDVSKNVQAVGRMIGSKRLKTEDFDDLSASLRMSADTLDGYGRMLEKRSTK